MDVKIIAVVVGALLGGAISTAGFYFKNRKEVKEKINESLFQLLEVWSLLAMIRVISSDKFYSVLIDRIKAHFPHEKIDENESELIKEGMIKALPLLTGMEAGGFDSSFLHKYKSSVNELAKIYPLLAFELDRNQMLINILGSIDKLASEPLKSEGEIAMLGSIRELMLGESFEGFESDLIALASSSGYRNKKKTKLQIYKIKSRLTRMPSDVFDAYIEKVIAPAVQAHYDNLGIKNPNL
tara:strand:+ start:486 stop:1205 length:720 start_codon:yes stop_codon:yes gene_type:complete